MSFKEVRDLGEHLKLLGFPRTLPLQTLSSKYGSLSSFRIIAEILQWLASSLEPGTQFLGGCDSESDRILLIRSATEFFVTKSGIKLNPRKLYASSSAAASELQKITKLLLAVPFDEEKKDEFENYQSLNQMDFGNKFDDLRRARELATDLVSRGTELSKLLSQETANQQEVQISTTARPIELGTAERALKNAISAIQIKLQSNKAQLEKSRIEANAINSKLQRKKSELERTKQRLEALQKIRPPHMQEFEECEQELQKLFEQYFQRIHVRDALKAQLAARTKKTSRNSSPIGQKPTELSMTLMPEGLLSDDDDDEDGNVGIDDVVNFNDNFSGIHDKDIMFKNDGSGVISDTMTPSARPSTATCRGRPITGRQQIGAISGRSRARGGDSHDEDSTFGSSDDEMELGGRIGLDVATMEDIIAPDKAEEEVEFFTDDDMSISKIPAELPLRPKTANKSERHSDEDF